MTWRPTPLLVAVLLSIACWVIAGWFLWKVVLT